MASKSNDVGKEIKNIIAELEEITTELERQKLIADEIIGGVGDPLIVSGEHANIIKINRPAIKILGLKESEVQDKPLQSTVKLYHEDGGEVDPFDNPFLKSVMSGQVTKGTYVIKSKPNNVSVNLTATPLLLKGKPAGVIGIFRDVTEERDIDRMKSEFIGLASHQLRTPLSSIMLYSNMLLDGYAGKLTGKQTEFTKTISKTADHLIDLVNQLLNISRIEAGRLAISPVKTDVTRLYKDSVKELEAKIKANQTDFKMTVPKGFPKIMLDPLLMKEIFINIVSNAVKYSPPKNPVTVRVYIKNGKFITEIADHGYGIPKEEQIRIFSKFYRGTNILDVVAEGTGLGIYLVKKIIDASEGTIRFTSAKGRGTTFWVTYPLSGMKKVIGERKYKD